MKYDGLNKKLDNDTFTNTPETLTCSTKNDNLITLYYKCLLDSMSIM